MTKEKPKTRDAADMSVALSPQKMHTNRDERVSNNDVGDSVRVAPAVVRQNPGLRKGAWGGGASE
jgi:hypothetical protein